MSVEFSIALESLYGAAIMLSRKHPRQCIQQARSQLFPGLLREAKGQVLYPFKVGCHGGGVYARHILEQVAMPSRCGEPFRVGEDGPVGRWIGMRFQSVDRLRDQLVRHPN